MATPLGYPRPSPQTTCGKEVFSVAVRIQAFLLVLGAIVAGALNGAAPWGP